MIGRLKILVVCGAGMGSSLYLKLLASEVLNELGVDADVETSDVTNAAAQKVDLLVTDPLVFNTMTNVQAKNVLILKDTLHKDAIKHDMSKAVSGLIDSSSK